MNNQAESEDLSLEAIADGMRATQAFAQASAGDRAEMLALFALRKAIKVPGWQVLRRLIGETGSSTSIIDGIARARVKFADELKLRDSYTQTEISDALAPLFNGLLATAVELAAAKNKEDLERLTAQLSDMKRQLDASENAYTLASEKLQAVTNELEQETEEKVKAQDEAVRLKGVVDELNTLLSSQSRSHAHALEDLQSTHDQALAGARTESQKMLMDLEQQLMLVRAERSEEVDQLTHKLTLAEQKQYRLARKPSARKKT